MNILEASTRILILRSNDFSIFRNRELRITMVNPVLYICCQIFVNFLEFIELDNNHENNRVR